MYTEHFLQKAVGATGDGTQMELVGVDVPPIERVGVQVEGITTATVIFEVSNDGVTYYACDLAAVGTIETPVSQATADGFFTGTVCARYFRARISAFTTGTITVTAVGT